MENLEGKAWIWSKRKRTIDLTVVAAFGMPVAAGCAVSALGLAVEMRRKPWFVQPRVGQSPEELLGIPKLVTLKGPIQHEPSPMGHEHELSSKLGNVVRKWHVDEGPQLLLVAKGAMSVVGIRPVVPSHHERIMGELSRLEQAEYLEALKISKPGIVTPNCLDSHTNVEETDYGRAMNTIEYAHSTNFKLEFGMQFDVIEALLKNMRVKDQ